MERAPLGELEHQVYEILRKKGEATVKEVCALLDHTRKYTTIMTVMSRMVDKGEIQREKEGKCFVYWVNEAKRKKMPSLLMQLKHKLFRGKTNEMVAYLLGSDEKITQEELSELEKMIAEMKKR